MGNGSNYAFESAIASLKSLQALRNKGTDVLCPFARITPGTGETLAVRLSWYGCVTITKELHPFLYLLVGFTNTLTLSIFLSSCSACPFGERLDPP